MVAAPAFRPKMNVFGHMAPHASRFRGPKFHAAPRFKPGVVPPARQGFQAVLGRNLVREDHWTNRGQPFGLKGR